MLRHSSIFLTLPALQAKDRRKSPCASKMIAMKLANLTKIFLKTLRSVGHKYQNGVLVTNMVHGFIGCHGRYHWSYQEQKYPHFHYDSLQVYISTGHWMTFGCISCIILFLTFSCSKSFHWHLKRDVDFFREKLFCISNFIS